MVLAWPSASPSTSARVNWCPSWWLMTAHRCRCYKGTNRSLHAYILNSMLLLALLRAAANHRPGEVYISTQDLAMRWLRTTKGLWICEGKKLMPPLFLSTFSSLLAADSKLPRPVRRVGKSYCASATRRHTHNGSNGCKGVVSTCHFLQTHWGTLRNSTPKSRPNTLAKTVLVELNLLMTGKHPWACFRQCLHHLAWIKNESKLVSSIAVPCMRKRLLSTTDTFRGILCSSSNSTATPHQEQTRHRLQVTQFY